MNTYRISVDLPKAELIPWLQANECPNAADSIKDGGRYVSEFGMSGNVSTVSVLSVFDKIGIRHCVYPIGGSAPIADLIPPPGVIYIATVDPQEAA